MNVPLRSRWKPFAGSDDWQEVEFRHDLNPQATAILLCDVWDIHWCAGANRRGLPIAERLETLVTALRQRGMFVIHAPSDCMQFYQDTPQRARMIAASPVEPPAPREIFEPPLPVDASDGGCDDEPQCRQWSPWTRQHPAITVAPEDGVSDNGREVYNALRERNINHLLIAGVHTNMCVLGRSFAIRQMTRWGVRCTLVRDLTDTMYNPRMAPFVPHEQGTELVIQHIERYWCPTVRSEDLLLS